jgi:osmotically-inducible protein OsmY
MLRQVFAMKILKQKGGFMLRTLALATACTLFAACSQQTGTLPQGSSAESEIGQSAKQQKEQIDNAADEAQKQVKEAASAQKDRIQAEAKAAKAQIEADKAAAQAAEKTEQKNLDEQSRKIHEAVGSAQQRITGTQKDDNQLLREARGATKGQTNVTVSVDGGTVTLDGTVSSDQEKTSLENQVKQLDGVQNVNNNLKVDNNK